MPSESSIAVRLVACLVAAMLFGSAVAGVASAAAGPSSSVAPTIDDASLESDRLTASIGSMIDETTEPVENATDTAIDEGEGTTDTVENATNTTTDDSEPVVDGTTDIVDDAANNLTTIGESVENATENTTSAVDDTVDETTETVDTTAPEVDAELESDAETGPNASVGAEASVGGATANADRDDATDDGSGTEPAAGDDGSGDANSSESGPPDAGDAATDAVLVGLLGAITASGAAAGGAGAGASGAGAASGASTATASWLGQARELDALRRAGSDLWKLLPIFRYSRYDDSDPLEHDRRRAVYEAIRDEPGAYLSQLSDRTGVPLSTVRHHVRVLEEEDLVTDSKVNGKRRYFLEEADAELQAALAEPAKRDVLEALADLGRAHNGRLADELGRDPSTISHHLSALEEDGLVVREKDGRAIVNELPPAVEAALIDEPVPAADSRPAPADD
ncbi:winged helix-turn-helix transcriptional regulator [Natrinema salifodinae]|uniref:Regulatory protein, arsR family n=1 Tax=Natrinema salifodinae TaxID=1202768 RepID=A0A1I0M9I7_9EURY|nr:helix-turn-helix domain-containing protein [Natrinema salifodinae]SEV84788.1 regulatory protein, arsR family [Natrinema salifodinae]